MNHKQKVRGHRIAHSTKAILELLPTTHPLLKHLKPKRLQEDLQLEVTILSRINKCKRYRNSLRGRTAACFTPPRGEFTPHPLKRASMSSKFNQKKFAMNATKYWSKKI
jgi:hypothetical protein